MPPLHFCGRIGSLSVKHSSRKVLPNNWHLRIESTYSVCRSFSMQLPDTSDLFEKHTELAQRAQEIVKISKAMKAYLKRAEEHDKFLKEKTTEFQIGKRHLANMMGADPETFTQADIDAAIQYLFPSALYEKTARPKMKPPEEVFPRRRAAEFDATGRPFHSLFYTANPNFYQVLHDTASNISKLNSVEDDLVAKQGGAIEREQADLIGSEWYTMEELQARFIEKLDENQYDNFVKALQRLADHPLSERVKEFLLSQRKPMVIKSLKEEAVPKPILDEETGRYYVESPGSRKWAKATVKVWSPGTGKVDINGRDILYFELLQSREEIMFPLQFSGLLGKVDFEAKVDGGGITGQAGAIRLGLALCLRSFLLDKEDMIERMRLAGLLTYDRRVRERDKPGQKGARAKYTWKKR